MPCCSLELAMLDQRLLPTGAGSRTSRQRCRCWKSYTICGAAGYSAPTSDVMSLTDCFASPNSIEVLSS
jgi:hypothetical protein